MSNNLSIEYIFKAIYIYILVLKLIKIFKIIYNSNISLILYEKFLLGAAGNRSVYTAN